MEYLSVTLHKGKDSAIRRFHPWVFSGAIAHKQKGIKAGDIVQLLSSTKEILGYGFYEEGSIAVKVISFDRPPHHTEFWIDKIRAAWKVRQMAGLTDSSVTNAYRLIFSEADGIPGLIIDYYHGTAVFQANSEGIYSVRQLIVDALRLVYGEELKAVYDKSARTLLKQAGIQTTDSYLYGSGGSNEILEYGLKFSVDWVGGQKTGFFLDQRDNRSLLGSYAKGRDVLNTFCYTGGFSVYALAGGARLVHSVDASAKAVEACAQNLALNGFDLETNSCISTDALPFLESIKDKYDLIVLDPPAFAKHAGQKHKALSAYRHINRLAIENIRPNGIIFTFSCSQVVDRFSFQGAIMAAAIESKREVVILHSLTHPADHPQNIFHPEGEYLKGMVLLVK
ncbi:MAG: class I SAM-dependent rRNA methyltransferase [Bacteroidales bacterium]|nr:class I SAM-dependent rRNA methyltransferase [Bacteroidales bacterium]